MLRRWWHDLVARARSRVRARTGSAKAWRPHPPGAALTRLRDRWRTLSAPALFVLSFGLLIAVGTLGLLVLPGLYTGSRLGFVDALFTATSAVCVTGLIVVDTATYFTFWGQLWLLLLIQLGGLGLITFTTLIMGALGKDLSLRTEVLATPIPTDARGRDAVRLSLTAARFTLAIEAAGALLLLVQWLPTLGEEAAWHAIFHSVSAFCNAGFSTFSNSLVGYADAPLVLLTISALFVAGGLGFLSTEELVRWYRAGGRRGARRLSTHTYAAVWTTVVLLGVGTIGFLAFEWHGVLEPLGYLDRVVNAWFMSATPRTAGFNAVSYAQIGNMSAFLTIMLMVIGGSPGSTAGGIKTTAFAVLAALAVSRMRGRSHAVLHDRTIPDGTVQRIVSLAVLVTVLLTVSMFVISGLESRGATLAEQRGDVLPLLFEVVSAFGTVGLSMDATPTLSTGSRVLLVFEMFVGRIGPLAFFAALSLSGRHNIRGVRLANEDVIVG